MQRDNEHVTSEAQRRAFAKYQAEKVDTVTIRFPKGDKSIYMDAAKAAGQSLNQFAITAMKEKIKRDNLMPDN